MLKSILALALSLTLAGCAGQAVAPVAPAPPPAPPIETPAPPVTPATPGFTTHNGDTWSIQLPNDFVTKESEEINLIAVNEKTHVMVIVFAADTDMTLAQYVKESIDEIRNSGLRLISLKKIQWLGHDAAEVVLLRPSTKGITKGTHWATINDGRVYNLGCIVPLAKPDDETKACKAAFDSFKVTPVVKKK